MNTFNSVKQALIALQSAPIYNPRGCETKELLFVSFKVNDNEVYLNYPSRKLKFSYIKDEIQWYLKANKYDTSIAEKAKIWKALINTDGSISSHYGSIIFNGQFVECANTLLNDFDTRRALIYIGDNDNLNSDSKDKRCTCYLQFMIRENKLHMICSMRSNDAIFGLGNDLPFFSFVHNLMYNYIKGSGFDYLEKGDYIHCANSFHVYKRHYKMLDKIVKEQTDITKIPPKIESKEEVIWLMDKRKNMDMALHNKWDFSIWLYNLSYDKVIIKETINTDGTIVIDKIVQD